ncbi:hypothetical protein HPB47_019859 [Ixodes persulcatus]|uniref:Uncharacterized protein n=1 Tax=Ixodes persulcatus TaxID=34615 RepID=A0AC60QGZ8_IXOPE|nr:hypothetical protein HPB47_019859 [Ixodes persulcatus]
MKSVKHFLHSFGTSGRVPEGCKFPGGDDVSEGTALPDSRPDILTSVKKECVQRSGTEVLPESGRRTLRKPGGSFQVVVGSSSSAGTRKGKKYSCERIRQLESEVWVAERELLLLKEKHYDFVTVEVLRGTSSFLVPCQLGV